MKITMKYVDPKMSLPLPTSPEVADMPVEHLAELAASYECMAQLTNVLEDESPEVGKQYWDCAAEFKRLAIEKSAVEKWLNQLASLVPNETETTEKKKLRRNGPCPCNSGLKFKRCCKSWGERKTKPQISAPVLVVEKPRTWGSFARRHS
ncbi:MAG: SEC-C metal-binding domain-containing protein, partial [Alphaproteobacteria bacterium]|nr:SEC-C metal-binding domain-containing protein [Alphaproteobacteria bacterium]